MASPVMGVLVSQSTVTPSLCSRSFPLNAPHLPGKKAGRRSQQGRWCVGIRAEAMATEKLGVKVLKNPPEEKLAELGVRSWPKWGCQPSKFPWEYTAKETCYLLEGKVKVFPEGHGDDGYVEIEAGDLVEFPKGMKAPGMSQWPWTSTTISSSSSSFYLGRHSLPLQFLLLSGAVNLLA